MARQGHTPVWLLAEYSSHPNIWLGNGATPMKLKGKACQAVCPWVQDSSKKPLADSETQDLSLATRRDEQNYHSSFFPECSGLLPFFTLRCQVSPSFLRVNPLPYSHYFFACYCWTTLDFHCLTQLILFHNLPLFTPYPTKLVMPKLWASVVRASTESCWTGHLL